jgi:hypothetical protein
VLVGRWGFGLPLLLAAAPWLVAAPPPFCAPLLRGRPVAKLAFVVLCLFLASLWVRAARRTELAEQQLRWLRAEIGDYAANVGALPASLGELRWRTAERFGLGAPRDPWGRAFAYARQAGGRGFELSSAGPDGIPSADDLR